VQRHISKLDQMLQIKSPNGKNPLLFKKKKKNFNSNLKINFKKQQNIYLPKLSAIA
jgi:hypothetical protein